MSKEIDDYIVRINNILSSSNRLNIGNSSQKKSNVSTKKTKNKSGPKRFPYQSFEQLQSVCRRASILHTQGIYVKPPERHACDRKRKRGAKKLTERETSNGEMPKKTFGSGRVGVSCETFGVKGCTCCKPHNEEDLLLIGHMFEPRFHNKFDELSIPEPVDFIDLTKPSSSKKWDNTVIDISDSSLDNSVDIDLDENIKMDISDPSPNDLLIVDLDETITDDTKNFANVDDITSYVNLVTADYDEEEMRKHEDEIEETIKTEVVDAPNFADVGNITDYINLVTTDYDEDEMRKYEEELSKRFDTEDFEIIEANTVSENVPVAVDQPKIVTNNTQIINSSLVLSCPICLESLNTKESMSTTCGHIFCAECIKEVIKRTKSCPNCRKKLTLKNIHPIYLG